MKQSYFCDFDIKNKFLDLKNPHVAIFRHQIAPEMELQHYLQNSEAKFFVYLLSFFASLALSTTLYYTKNMVTKNLKF